MKKTLSIVLALCLAVAMFSSFALIATPADPSDPFVLKGISVTDAAGYAAPYLAVDSAAAFVENQAVYVVVTVEILEDDSDTATLDGDEAREITVTSSTLDLSYAESTMKAVKKAENGAIIPLVSTPVNQLPADAYTSSTNKYVLTVTPDTQTITHEDKLFIAFVAITKPATAGEVKASLKVSTLEFAAVNATYSSLPVYDASGLKYTIVRLASGNDYAVYAGKFDVDDLDKNYLFTYAQSGDDFDYIAYNAVAPLTITDTHKATWSYDGKLLVLNEDPDKDLTAVVAEVNTFFGFSFAYGNAADDENFEDKTAGNPIVVTDTYAYVTAIVTEGDGDVDIAPTGDFSANIVIVMAASAVLAAAALAFVAKKARD